MGLIPKYNMPQLSAFHLSPPWSALDVWLMTPWFFPIWMEKQDDGGKLTLSPSETAVSATSSCFQTRLYLHSQHLFLVCLRWPVHVSSFLGCRWHASLQISVSGTLKTSHLLLVQKDVMVKVNIPPAHAWWESVLLSPHHCLNMAPKCHVIGQLLLELKVSLKAWHTFHQGSLLSKTHWPQEISTVRVQRTWELPVF